MDDCHQDCASVRTSYSFVPKYLVLLIISDSNFLLYSLIRVTVQVLCSYITLPLYALVTQVKIFGILSSYFLLLYIYTCMEHDQYYLYYCLLTDGIKFQK